MKIKQALLATCLLALGIFTLADTSHAQAPRTISYQGQALNNGAPVTGVHNVTIRFYGSGGGPLHEETHTNVVFNGRMFNILIGGAIPLPGSLTFDQQYFLGVSIDGGAELTPRTPLTSVPYALRAEAANSLAPGATGVVTSVNGQSGAVTIAGGGITSVSNVGGAFTVNTEIANNSIGLQKLDPTGASDGMVLTVQGGGLTWGMLGGGGGDPIPFTGSVSLGTPAFDITNTSTGPALSGTLTLGSGQTSAVVGNNASTTGGSGAMAGASGLLGTITSTTPGGFSAGVRGINNGAAGLGIGVIGYQNGSGWGVYGETPNGIGIYGLVTGAASSSIGVKGETYSTNGAGVEARYSGPGAGTALHIVNGAIEQSGSVRPAFVHTATVANKLSANGTDIDNILTNADPNAILIVTQKLNPNGIIYNDSPIGVYYNNTRQKWEIFNQDGTAVPTNAQFNVLVIKQ